MKKIVILVIALLSTGIVLSSSLKKGNHHVTAAEVKAKKSSLQNKDMGAPLYDAVGRAD